MCITLKVNMFQINCLNVFTEKLSVTDFVEMAVFPRKRYCATINPKPPEQYDDAISTANIVCYIYIYTYIFPITNSVNELARIR